jgi:hypothetical protein
MQHRLADGQMATPTISFRVSPERQAAVRDMVNAVKDNPALATLVLELINSGGGEAFANLGPFRSEAAALSFLVGRLSAALRPEAVFLFGSRAAGVARPDSDFDLLVVLPNSASGPPDYRAAYAPVAGCGLGVDVVPCRLADFEAERNQPGTICFAAEHEGRLLYARSGSQWRKGRGRNDG